MSVPIRQVFECLDGRIKGLIEAGMDARHVEYRCDVIFVSEFDGVSALKADALHPEHPRLRDELEDPTIGRFLVIEEARR
jgi:hypothetical protein